MSDATQGPAGDAGRLREHPDARFAPARHQFDLQAAARELAAERTPSAPTGHRQKTLYSRGRATIALFRFDAGGALRDHAAAGTVSIHVIEGRLRVRAEGTEHALPAGALLVLAPGVSHDVSADEPTVMLLHVHLDQPSTTRE